MSSVMPLLLLPLLTTLPRERLMPRLILSTSWLVDTTLLLSLLRRQLRGRR